MWFFSPFYVGKNWDSGRPWTGPVNHQVSLRFHVSSSSTDALNLRLLFPPALSHYECPQHPHKSDSVHSLLLHHVYHGNEWKEDEKEIVKHIHWAKDEWKSHYNFFSFWKLSSRATTSYNDHYFFFFCLNRRFHAQIFKRRQYQLIPIFQTCKEPPKIQAEETLNEEKQACTQLPYGNHLSVSGD